MSTKTFAVLHYKYTHNPDFLFENTSYKVIEKIEPYPSDGGERFIYIIGKNNQ